MKTDEQTLKEALERLCDDILIGAKSDACPIMLSALLSGAVCEAKKALQADKSALGYETPEQYEKRTGLMPDAKSLVFFKESITPELWAWNMGNCGEIVAINRNRIEAGINPYLCVLAEKGKGAPPNDWRPI